MGTDCFIEHDMEISRQHYLPGTIKIGNNVLFAKHVFIDYSGSIEIKDNVRITNGVIIETHHHPFHSDYKMPRDIINVDKLLIEEGCNWFKSNNLELCNYIGKYARVGAGVVVTKDVPDYATEVGVPAKIIKIKNDS